MAESSTGTECTLAKERPVPIRKGSGCLVGSRVGRHDAKQRGGVIWGGINACGGGCQNPRQTRQASKHVAESSTGTGCTLAKERPIPIRLGSGCLCHHLVSRVGRHDVKQRGGVIWGGINACGGGYQNPWQTRQARPNLKPCIWQITCSLCQDTCERFTLSGPDANDNAPATTTRR